MADDNVDWRFLGRQVQILQSDVRDLKAAQFRLDSDVASLRSEVAQVHAEQSRTSVELSRLETEVREMRTHLTNFERHVDSRLDQMAQTTATNMQVLLAAIGKQPG